MPVSVPDMNFISYRAGGFEDIFIFAMFKFFAVLVLKTLITLSVFSDKRLQAVFAPF